LGVGVAYHMNESFYFIVQNILL